MTLGESVSDAELQARIDDQKPGHCCTLIYTSGTTGNPKAVMIPHDNVTWTTRANLDHQPAITSGPLRVVSYLPLSHIAAQVVDIHSPMGGLLMGLPAEVRPCAPRRLEGLAQADAHRRQAHGVLRRAARLGEVRGGDAGGGQENHRHEGGRKRVGQGLGPPDARRRAGLAPSAPTRCSGFWQRGAAQEGESRRSACRSAACSSAARRPSPWTRSTTSGRSRLTSWRCTACPRTRGRRRAASRRGSRRARAARRFPASRSRSTTTRPGTSPARARCASADATS